jgi:hypothetical protein
MVNPKESVKKSSLAYPSGYKFNLPPHSWSLPVSTVVHERLPGKTRSGIINSGSSTLSHSRRGKIWRYADLASLVDSTETNPSFLISNRSDLANSSTSFGFGERLGRYLRNAGPKENLQQQQQQQAAADASRKKINYGFQFMWNPTVYQASTGISANVVPAATDALAFLNLFQGTGTVQFQLQLNRINDFACFKSNNSSNLSQYYGPNAGLTGDYAALIVDLKKRGTLADIEFLYKTINGDNLKNSANQDTSDIGIIIPTLVRVDIGPYTQVGIIQSLSVTHLMFTQDMIPIQSTVDINLQVLSAYGFGNQDSTESTNVGDNPSSFGTAPKVGPGRG